ncbi:MAG: patatin-like phospholipase family protein [Ignavibacteriae bacterium]|nr:patatin-like phospholipase family protein [Ignavibacteriota bacterium]
MPGSFNILSIDGGGSRGVFPAKFIAAIEEELIRRRNPKTQIFQHFNLIAGTSTGGIIAISLALGIPAQEILDLYIGKAAEIFGNRRAWLKRLFLSAHVRKGLEDNIRNAFKKHNGGNDPRLIDCKTAVCIPIYDLFEGKPSVLKSKYHPRFTRDYHIPAYLAAMATSAAPTFFDPVTSSYTKIDSTRVEDFSNKIDGGVFANNPTLLAIIEAQKAFGKSLNEIQILSLGTGSRKYTDANERKRWGLLYWMNLKRKRLIDLFMQSQSQHTNNLISLLQRGIDKVEQNNFNYVRIDIELTDDLDLSLDEIDPSKLRKLVEKASIRFQNEGGRVIDMFCNK